MRELAAMFHLRIGRPRGLGLGRANGDAQLPTDAINGGFGAARTFGYASGAHHEYRDGRHTSLNHLLLKPHTSRLLRFRDPLWVYQCSPEVAVYLRTKVCRVLAYQSSGPGPHDSHTRLQVVPYTAAIEVLS